MIEPEVDPGLTEFANTRDGEGSKRRKAYSNILTFCRELRTEDYDDKGRVRPFPYKYAFVRRFFRLLGEDKEIVAVRKDSRRMLATTMACIWILWNILRTDTKETGAVWGACVISKNENEAKKVIDRIRKMYERLPEILKRPLERNSSEEIRVQGGGFVESLPASGQGPRGSGYNFGVLDELAFQPYADQNYRALKACCKFVLTISTPDGEGNLHHELVTGKIEGVTVFQLNYRDHPKRRPDTQSGKAWYEKARKGVPEVDWLREQEGSFDTYVEAGWYQGEWNDNSAANLVDWDGRSLIRRGWDFGYLRPACTWSYVNKHKQWCVMHELLGDNVDIQEFAKTVLDISKAKYPGAVFYDCGDPACIQRKPIRDQLGHNTEWDILKNMGIEIQFDQITPLSRRDGHRMVRRLLMTRDDGRFGLIIDPGCEDLIKGFRGGYRRPEGAKARALELEEQNKADNRFRHLHDALRYAIMQTLGRESLPEYNEAQDSGDTIAWLKSLQFRARKRRYGRRGDYQPRRMRRYATDQGLFELFQSGPQKDDSGGFPRVRGPSI